jgi:hypothetical protein
MKRKIKLDPKRQKHIKSVALSAATETSGRDEYVALLGAILHSALRDGHDPEALTKDALAYRED